MICGFNRTVKVLLEAMLVVGTGIFLALAANQVSPHGLVLTRNYFPNGTNKFVRAAPALRPGGGPGTDSAPMSVQQLIAAQMKQEGLQLIDRQEAVQLFHDSQSKRGVVLVDARDPADYLEGHIPGAHEFDPYHPEKYFPDVLPPCQAAQKVLVYCNGGDCDDSQTAALLLKDVGIPIRKLFVYGGGITDWTNNNLPIETGSLKSGNGEGPMK